MSDTVRRAIQYPDFILKASAGLIAGVTPFFKFGVNLDIDTGSVPEDVISTSGIKLFPTTESTLDIVSTSASDGVVGTGIQQITIQGLDTDYNVVSEDIIMNGTTAVTSTLSYLRLDTAKGLTAGSSGFNAGDITIAQSVTTAVVFASSTLLVFVSSTLVIIVSSILVIIVSSTLLVFVSSATELNPEVTP